MFLDEERLLDVVTLAFAVSPVGGRWQQSIARAWREILDNPYMHWTGGSLIVLSPSGELYEAGPACQCRSYLFNKPCWHRAAASLLELYFEESPPESHRHE